MTPRGTLRVDRRDDGGHSRWTIRNDATRCPTRDDGVVGQGGGRAPLGHVGAVMVTGAAGLSARAATPGGSAAIPMQASLSCGITPFYRTWLSIRELGVPTMAAIDGAAIGAGAALALATCGWPAAGAVRRALPAARDSPGHGNDDAAAKRRRRCGRPRPAARVVASAPPRCSAWASSRRAGPGGLRRGGL